MCYFCWTRVIPRNTLLLKVEKRQVESKTQKQWECVILKEQAHDIHVTNTLSPSHCSSTLFMWWGGDTKLMLEEHFCIWAHRVYRATDSVNEQKNAHLEELSKLTWSLEVFETGPLSFPFSACKPRHTALNVRTQLPSSPGTPVSKSGKDPGRAADVPHRGAGNHHPFTASPSAPAKCLLGHWDQHVQAQALTESDFSRKKQCRFLFFSMWHWKALSLWHLGDVVTGSLGTYCLASSMDICSKEHPFVSGINTITKARDARLIIV